MTGPGQVLIGMDVGGTKIHGVLICDQRVACSLRRPTGHGCAGVVASCTQVARGLLERAGIGPEHVAGVGVGIPGLVDTATGTITNAVNLGIDAGGLALAGELAGRLGIEGVAVDNDVTAGALGAVTALGLTDRTVGYISVGTGLAAGFVQRGVPYRGGGAAGEIGHVPVDPTGARCACGQIGCLETIASGSALDAVWPSASAYPADEVFAAALAGEQAAIAVRDWFVNGLALACQMVCLTFDPEHIVIGGGIAALQDRLATPLRRITEERAGQSAFLASLRLADRISMVPADQPVAAVGAALLCQLGEFGQGSAPNAVTW